MNEGLEITQLHSFCSISSLKINKRQIMLDCFRTRHSFLYNIIYMEFFFNNGKSHSYDILGARMLWKPKEARIFKKFKKIYRSTSVIW